MLNIIEQVMYGHKLKLHPYVALTNAKKKLQLNYQRADDSLDEFYETFNAQVKVIESIGGGDQY